MKTPQLMCMSVVLSGLISLPVQAHINHGYIFSIDGSVVKNSFGECLRTNYWTSENALPECEGGMKKMDMDTDGDGIADSKDQCPDTVPGASVDAMGCAKDSDNDGIHDGIDRCANTQAGVRVDANGCALDEDKDGVADGRDQCPGTNEGALVDSKGCEVQKDSDGDGIVDANDQCAGTAPGTVVDKTGCKLKEDIRIENVQFETGTAVLNTASQDILDNVARTLIENEHLNFEVAGHTDNTGAYQTNVDLSNARAQSVRQYLVDKGVAADRLTAQGYGPDRPIASNDTREGRSMNRRVELRLQ